MSGFFRELERRRVFRAAAAYAVVVWLAIQVADVVFPVLEEPNEGMAVHSGRRVAAAASVGLGVILATVVLGAYVAVGAAGGSRGDGGVIQRVNADLAALRRRAAALPGGLVIGHRLNRRPGAAPRGRGASSA